MLEMFSFREPAEIAAPGLSIVAGFLITAGTAQLDVVDLLKDHATMLAITSISKEVVTPETHHTPLVTGRILIMIEVGSNLAARLRQAAVFATICLLARGMYTIFYSQEQIIKPVFV
jgi:hypothetical protein